MFFGPIAREKKCLIRREGTDSYAEYTYMGGRNILGPTMYNTAVKEEYCSSLGVRASWLLGKNVAIWV